MKRGILCANILSVMAIIISGFAVYCYYYNGKPVYYDSSGFLVSVLSILVVVLMGWQIFNSIDIDKKLNDAENRINKEKNKEFAIISFEFYSVFYTLVADDKMLEKRLLILVVLLMYASLLDQEDQKKFLNYIEEYERILRKICNTERKNIKKLDEQFKNLILEKIAIRPNIRGFKTLKEILEK